MGRFLAGFVTGIVVLVLAGLVYAFTAVDVSARRGNDRLDLLLGAVSERAVKRAAPDSTNPLAKDPEAISEGLGEFREDCVACHAAPGVEAADFAEGLQPPPPRLWSKGAQTLSDGELYWIVANGVRMTGMPAFGKDHPDREIWELVSAIRALPGLTDAQKAMLSAPERENTSGQEPPASAPAPAPSPGGDR